MRAVVRAFVCVSLMSWPALADAQSAAEPSGHWAGTIQVQGNALSVEVDLVRGTGEFVGAVSIPSQGVTQMPLSNVSIEGRSVTFQMIQSVAGDNTFKGVVSPTGQLMAGVFTHDVYTMNFEMTRTGEARLPAPAHSTTIDKALEGTWRGTLDVQGQSLRVELRVSTQPDGTASGTLVSVDQGALEIPVTAIVQRGTAVAIDVLKVGGAFQGVHHADHRELSGTWTQGALTLPLTLTQVAADDSAHR